jgi:hypothetical protein
MNSRQSTKSFLQAEQANKDVGGEPRLVRSIECLVGRELSQNRTSIKITLGDPHSGCRLLRYRLQCQSTAGAAPSLCTNQTEQNHLSMTVFIHTNKDAHQTWLADFLSSNITISGRRCRVIARSDNQPEIQMHRDWHSQRESVTRDNESKIEDRSAHLN